MPPTPLVEQDQISISGQGYRIPCFHRVSCVRWRTLIGHIPSIFADPKWLAGGCSSRRWESWFTELCPKSRFSTMIGLQLFAPSHMHGKPLWPGWISVRISGQLIKLPQIFCAMAVSLRTRPAQDVLQEHPKEYAGRQWMLMLKLIRKFRQNVPGSCPSRWCNFPDGLRS